MANEHNMRIVSFLGTGNYQQVTYVWNGRMASPTPFVVCALAELAGASQVDLLATPEAWGKHGAALEEALINAGLPAPRRVDIPTARTDSELWEQFQIIKGLLRDFPGEPVLLDITHSLRHQPIFGSAVLTFLRAVDQNPPDIRIAYGAFELKSADGEVPVLELSPFMDLVDMALDMQIFLRTGRAEGLAATASRLGARLNREWAQTREGPQPILQALGKRLEEFGSDLETLRTGAMLLGEQPKKTRQSGSAWRLLQTLREAEDSVGKHLPPLADILGALSERIEPLALPVETPALNTPEGARALKHLARWYYDLGRYAEAMVTIREGWITRHAGPDAASPGLPGFSAEARQAAELAWLDGLGKRALSISEVRNDVEHGGYNVQPLGGADVKKMVGQLLLDFECETPA